MSLKLFIPVKRRILFEKFNSEVSFVDFTISKLENSIVYNSIKYPYERFYLVGEEYENLAILTLSEIKESNGSINLNAGIIIRYDWDKWRNKNNGGLSIPKYDISKYSVFKEMFVYESKEVKDNWNESELKDEFRIIIFSDWFLDSVNYKSDRKYGE